MFLHRAVRYTLAMSQLVALFPVRGILSTDSSDLSFRWFSVHLLYCTVVWIGHILFMYWTWVFTHFREPNGSLSAIENASLIRCAGPPLVINILFIQIALKWPNFVKKWECIEGRMIFRQNNDHLLRNLQMSTVVLALFRMVFYLINYFITVVRVTQCLGLMSLSQFIDTVYHVRFPQIMVHVPSSIWNYTYVTLILLEFCAIWSWLCADLIILDLSLLLQDKFKTFNNYLQEFKTKTSSAKFWQFMRHEFRKLLLLSELTDSILSPMIFAIVILETINITLLLYFMMTHSFTMLSYIFFAIAFGSHLSSDCWTLIAMASIFHEGRRPLRILHQLPTYYTSIETKRLYTEIKFSNIGLTGCKFFIVTRSMSLSIISTVVTYEVLLVQLGGLKHEGSHPTGTDKNSNSSGMEFCGWVNNFLNASV